MRRSFISMCLGIGCTYIGTTIGTAFLTPAAAETRALIAAGLGGDPDYEVEFQRHANRMGNRLQEVTDDVTVLLGDAADTEAVQTAFGALSGRLQADDILIFAFIGHGTWDGERLKFNVSGRDFTAGDLKGWLDEAPARHQVVIVTGASSGAAQDVLAADNRTVITATRSGEQRNATVFGRFFTAALEDEAADINKDQRITAIEAYRYAETGIERYYSGEGEMTTENPVQSGPEPVMVLALLGSQPSVDPALEHLYAERESLELDIAFLREHKDEYDTDDYFNMLQKLLLDLAMIEAQLESEDTP